MSNKRTFRENDWQLHEDTAKELGAFITNLQNAFLEDTTIDSLKGFDNVLDKGVQFSDKLRYSRELSLIYKGEPYHFNIYFYNRVNGNTIAVRSQVTNRNLIQYVLDEFIKINDKDYLLWHTGSIPATKGLSRDVAIQYLKKETPHLVVSNTEEEYIQLGELSEDEDISLSNPKVLDFMAHLIEFAIQRNSIKEKVKSGEKLNKQGANQHLYNLKDAFLTEWPIERLRTMSLEEYTNTERENSFCYWLESRTNDLGSVWGGSAYKFGIFRRAEEGELKKGTHRKTDGAYAWYGKYGNHKEEAFENIRNIIINIAEASYGLDLEAIEEIDLGDAVKWKIAFLYSEYSIINIYKHEQLKNAARYKGFNGTEDNYASLHDYLLELKPDDLDYYDYTKELWQQTDNPNPQNNTNMETPLNQIFFGPPGTGKTYHTINEAIKIADPDFYEEHKDDRDELKKRFKLLLMNEEENSKGQIAFTTFHQSFGYEDFVEGIKPLKPEEGDKSVRYDIREGIFKQICRQAKDSQLAVSQNTNNTISLSKSEFEQSHFYKMSLGNSQSEEDNEIYEYCIENNVISIGFGESHDFTGLDEKELKAFGAENDLRPFDIQAMNLFKNYLKVGNYVVISNGNFYIRAIGKVVGEYEYREESLSPNFPDFNHFREVEWIFTDKQIPATDIYNKNLSQQTIYKLTKNEINPDFFIKAEKKDDLNLPKNPKNFVLIVDEINRGNVSSIFGELITLIEPDKRAGATEELRVTLPYSKKVFTVPQNVYIIGTMNTADRSIEALDTALRRRFSFIEKPPNPQLILTEGALKDKGGLIDTINVVKILNTINKRIEKLLDKDHKIGHSYFLKLTNKQSLIDCFQNKVIPLLEEYFFSDYGKIGLILGDSFIEDASTNEPNSFASFSGYDDGVKEDLSSRVVYKIKDSKHWDFESIYK